MGWSQAGPQCEQPPGGFSGLQVQVQTPDQRSGGVCTCIGIIAYTHIVLQATVTWKLRAITGDQTKYYTVAQQTMPPSEWVDSSIRGATDVSQSE